MKLIDRLRELQKRTGNAAWDARQALKAKRHGVPLYTAWTISREARHEGLDKPLAYALCEQESAFHNIFGCDWGSGVAFCHEGVTKDKVQRLLAGGKPNGVGLTQLTSFGFVVAANDMGGAWKQKWQCREGFRVLHGLIQQLGKFKGIGAYNGGPGNPIDSYAREVEAKERVWKDRLH